MSEEYRNGVNAAAQLLRDAADDYDEMAARREQHMGRCAPIHKRTEVRVLREKAQLLRGQASRIQAELTP